MIQQLKKIRLHKLKKYIEMEYSDRGYSISVFEDYLELFTEDGQKFYTFYYNYKSFAAVRKAIYVMAYHQYISREITHEIDKEILEKLRDPANLL